LSSPKLVAVPLLALAALWSCHQAREGKGPVAFIAPATLNLRSQLTQRNSSVAVLKHGERVDILDVRRRHVKVRAASGAEGWVDAFELLSPADMQRIQRERQQGLKLPAEGAATAYELSNVHLDPNRKSPAFAQIPEGAVVSVLGRKLTPKLGAAPQPTLTFEPPKPQTRKQRKDRQAKIISKLPPRPPAPKPPANWERIWGAGETTEEEPPPAKREKPVRDEKPVVMDDWTLVRTSNNQVGWILSHNLMMAIPDEVAQYAAGGHITSYFELGAVNDEREGQKHNWLWTTASAGETADFDAWRVFLWNRRRHRYETSYRKRDLEGYFPVQVDPADVGRTGRTFRLVTKDDDGKLRRRTYLFDGTLVHLTATEDYRRDGVNDRPAAEIPATKSESWLQRSWSGFKKALSRKQ
jgi:hypothetical protein